MALVAEEEAVDLAGGGWEEGRRLEASAIRAEVDLAVRTNRPLVVVVVDWAADWEEGSRPEASENRVEVDLASRPLALASRAVVASAVAVAVVLEEGWGEEVWEVVANRVSGGDWAAAVALVSRPAEGLENRPRAAEEGSAPASTGWAARARSAPNRPPSEVINRLSEEEDWEEEGAAVA